MSIKTAAAGLAGLSATDIFFLKSLRHHWWPWRFHKLPLSRFEFPPVPPVDDIDRELASRIIAFYGRTAGSVGEGQRSPMWDRNISSNQAPLVEALRRKDEEAVAGILRQFLRTSVIRGIDAGDSYKAGNWRVHSIKLLDCLICLAEQIGTAEAESSQGASARALANGTESVVDAIQKELGIEIGVPAVGAPYGMRICGQLLTLNSAEYVRLAWRLHRATASLKRPVRVLEIGAGYGALARCFLQFDTVERYTIVDLPEMACLQAYYLGKCLGPSEVSLFGENPSRVMIVPPGALADVQPVDIVLNQDSLPEIPADAAKGYLSWIRDNLTGLFFSCNHETIVPGYAVTTVPNLIAEVGGLERISRDLCWSRPGYVEEVYRPIRRAG